MRASAAAPALPLTGALGLRPAGSVQGTEAGKPLIAATVKLDGGAPVQVDGVTADESAFVEISAHQGPLKGG